MFKHILYQKVGVIVIKRSENNSFFIIFWYAYVNSDPIGHVDLWGLTASDNKPYSLVEYEYQLRTNNSILQQSAEALAQKGEIVILYSQLLDSNGDSITERFANGLTSQEGLSVLQDTTKAYVTGLSQNELIDSLNSAKLVTGINMTDVTTEISKLNRMGFDISFDPAAMGAYAFSLAGFVYTSSKIDDIATKTTVNNQAYYKLKDEDLCELFNHEDGHYQSALATGNVGKWFLDYNSEYQKNLADGMSPDQAYYSLKDEREMYSFGPFSNTSAQRIKSVKY